MRVVFQGYNLIPFVTVLENVELILHLNHLPEDEAQRRAMDCSTISKSVTGGITLMGYPATRR